jgi:hypothetical protein
VWLLALLDGGTDAFREYCLTVREMNKNVIGTWPYQSENWGCRCYLRIMSYHQKYGPKCRRHMPVSVRDLGCYWTVGCVCVMLLARIGDDSITYRGSKEVVGMYD